MDGQDEIEDILASVEKYDAERDVWVELEGEETSLRVGRYTHAAAVL